MARHSKATLKGWAAGALAMVLAPAAQAGVVHTTDGKTHLGAVSMDEGRIVVVDPDGNKIRVPLEGVSEVSFDADSPAAADDDDSPADAQGPRKGDSSTHDSARLDGADSRWWTQRDIGGVAGPGKALITDDRLVLGDLGRGIGAEPQERTGKFDSFCFASQAMRGDGEVVARLRAFPDMQSARVGVMMRQSLDASSAFVMLGPDTTGQGDGLTRLLVRSADGRCCVCAGQADKPVVGAVWLKLERKGYSYFGYQSIDAKEWALVGRVDLPMPRNQDIFAGIAAATGAKTAPGRTMFDHCGVAATGSSDERLSPVGLMTRDGSILSGELASLDLRRATIVQDGLTTRVTGSRIGALLFVPLGADELHKLAQCSAGVMTLGGDCFEGEFKALEGRRVRVDSVPFGPHRFELGREAAALVLHAIAPGPCAFEIELTDGSVLRAGAVEQRGDRLSVLEPSAQPEDAMHFPVSHVLRMRRQ